MAEIGVSQAALVEPRGEGGRKLPQYIAALTGNYHETVLHIRRKCIGCPVMSLKDLNRDLVLCINISGYVAHSYYTELNIWLLSISRFTHYIVI